jgi:hypothetical protein
MNGQRLTESERKALGAAIERHGGTVPVARLLGLSVPTLVKLYAGLACSAGSLALYRTNRTRLADRPTNP